MASLSPHYDESMFFPQKFSLGVISFMKPLMSHAGGIRLLGPLAFANGLIVEQIICCPTIIRLHIFVLLKLHCSS